MANNKKSDSGASVFPGASGEGLELLGKYGTAMMDVMGKSGAEFAEFITNRLQEDVRTQQQLMSCRDVTKLAEIQSGYLKTAFAQYSDETGKMIKRGAELMDEVLKRAKG